MIEWNDIFEKAWNEREKIIKAKKASKHDGHPNCEFCQGEGYILEGETYIAVPCVCKTNKDYIKKLEKEVE